jgi:hypothetical protein
VTRKVRNTLRPLNNAMNAAREHGTTSSVRGCFLAVHPAACTRSRLSSTTLSAAFSEADVRQLRGPGTMGEYTGAAMSVTCNWP